MRIKPCRYPATRPYFATETVILAAMNARILLQAGWTGAASRCRIPGIRRGLLSSIFAETDGEMALQDRLRDDVRELQHDITALRHQLHRRPEIGQLQPDLGA